MNDSRSLSQIVVPRRRLIGMAAGGAVAALAARAFPGLALAQQDDDPTAFLASAYSLRARAATESNPSMLSELYAADSDLARFEVDRIGRLSTFGAVWAGKIEEFTSVVRLDDIHSSGDTVVARLYERVGASWIPEPRPVTAATREMMKKARASSSPCRQAREARSRARGAFGTTSRCYAQSGRG